MVPCEWSSAPEQASKLIIYSALGHPLGATGVRQVVTGVSELRRREKEGSAKGKQVLVTSMCIGSGMGAAGIFVV